MLLLAILVGMEVLWDLISDFVELFCLRKMIVVVCIKDIVSVTQENSSQVLGK